MMTAQKMKRIDREKTKKASLRGKFDQTKKFAKILFYLKCCFRLLVVVLCCSSFFFESDSERGGKTKES